MDQELFSAVDRFIGETIVEEDEGLRGAVEAAEEAGLPAIQVSPLLQQLVRYGRLISLEANPEYAEVARRSVEAASRPSASRATMDSSSPWLSLPESAQAPGVVGSPPLLSFSVGLVGRLVHPAVRFMGRAGVL